ncbi:MAG: class D beta-lactamase [Mesorhizobium sp.]|nr:class D beta-lactamase [Mesorhizobium sp.]MBL8576248.1 class D beta-lactamase [Mesorhizobium sp.]
MAAIPVSGIATAVRAVAAFFVLSLLAGPARADAVCTLLAEASTGKILHQDGECDRAMPPASTFKIPISLMGYDSGFLKDETTPVLPFKEGYADWRKEWRTDIDPTTWMKESVVWYSQLITQSLGEAKFSSYVQAFDYGNEDVSGDKGKNNGLTRSWLSSSLRITPLEQVAFIGKIVNRQLPVSEHAYQMTEAILGRYDLPGDWTVHGKTGAGFSVNADGSPDRQRPFGWYVGWAQKADQKIIFVRLAVLSKPQKMSPGMGTRDDLLKQLPALLDQVANVTD